MAKPPHGVGKEQFFVDRGYKIHGTVQVGVNDGTELGWFLLQNQVPILGFEPIPDVCEQTARNFSEEIDRGLIQLYPIALGDYDDSDIIRVPCNNTGEATQGSSFFLEEDFLEKDGGNYWISRNIRVPVLRFDTFARDHRVNLSLYDLLYVDVQGMELQVLKGFGDCLDGFRFLNVECSEKPTFTGEASAQQVIDFLASKGFSQQTPTLSHNDILFLKV